MDWSQPPLSEFPAETIDDIFAVMSNEASHHVIQYFQQVPGSVADLDSLVDYSVELTDESIDREQQAIVLHHTVLPKLADIGVLDYDMHSNTVEYHGHPMAEQLIGHTPRLEESHKPDQREEIINHLKDALQAEDSNMKNFHIREALRYLSFGADAANESDNC